MEVAVDTKSLDELARKSDILNGKWQIFKCPEEIDNSWYVIANSTWKDELGTSAKVSTAGQFGASKPWSYAIFIYTKNYFDTLDVKRVRERLRELGYTQRLYYKPDLYTYLNISHKTFPSFRAIRYAD